MSDEATAIELYAAGTSVNGVAKALHITWWEAKKLKGGKVAGCLSVGRSEDLAEARRLLADGVDVEAAVDRIADPGADLAGL